ncbi:helix-turn-helix domain-containing protein [Leptospira bouyouniensis]|uniref:Helix-turn-helix domain-containing protein n=1 Tax=Leptospira bouyouniensis TaxID=2484911 RepID=A0A7I0HPH4_9LEPT|nr:DUF6597 domain-containing transcriptional factor [Leptospira bouyouniensis]TGL04069.1 helix-turn-helix domain-containing protein [Leptospira bouyouniensis]
MILKFIEPNPKLKKYINKIWIHESPFSIGGKEGSIIPPNGKLKIMLPYSGHLISTSENKTEKCVENRIYLIGVRDKVTKIEGSKKNGSIGFELNPLYSYKFLDLNLFVISNNLYSFNEVFGEGEGNRIISNLSNYGDPVDKIKIIENFLLSRISINNRENKIFEYCLDLIEKQNGIIKVNDLESDTGFSRRYINKLFHNNLGISPKQFATIQRFQLYYKSIQFGEENNWNRNLIYESYFDESHFIKEFRKFTGFSPDRYYQKINEFSKYF